MERVNSNNFILNIVCGIISSVISIPITTLLKVILDKLTSNILSTPWFCVILVLVFISTFLLIKLLHAKRYPNEHRNHDNSTEILKEIKAVYPNRDALSEVLIELLPKARQVDILDLRGFYYTQQDSPLFQLISTSTKTEYRILLSEPDSDNTIYREKHILNKPETTLKSEIQASISVISNLNKDNVKLKLYRLHNVTRLIFVDDQLFLTPFRDEHFLAYAPTFRIPYDGALFKCYQDFFREIWNRQSTNIFVN